MATSLTPKINTVPSQYAVPQVQFRCPKPEYRHVFTLICADCAGIILLAIYSIQTIKSCIRVTVT